MSHDLFPLLSIVIRHSQTLLDVEDQGSVDSCSYLGINSAGNQLLALVNDILFGTISISDRQRLLRHDLRVLVSGILNCSDLLKEEAEASGQTDVISRLQEIRSAAERVIPFIDELVDFLRIQAGEITIHSKTSNTETIEQGNTAVVDSLVGGVEDVRMDKGALLIVDDNGLNRDVLSRLLEKQGYITAVAENGCEALDMLEKKKPDLLLLDVWMPEMNGYQVLKCLKKNPDLCDIPVIVISALDEIEGAVECIKMGAKDYVSQPIDLIVLQTRIETSLKNARLERELAEREKQERVKHWRAESQDHQQEVAQLLDFLQITCTVLIRLWHTGVTQIVGIETGEAESLLQEVARYHESGRKQVHVATQQEGREKNVLHILPSKQDQQETRTSPFLEAMTSSVLNQAEAKQLRSEVEVFREKEEQRRKRERAAQVRYQKRYREEHPEEARAKEREKKARYRAKKKKEAESPSNQSSS